MSYFEGSSKRSFYMLIVLLMLASAVLGGIVSYFVIPGILGSGSAAPPRIFREIPLQTLKL